MISRVEIPQLSTNIEEAMLTAWFRQEGERVDKGEALAELTTEKAAFEIESPRAGVVRKILAKEKSILPIGYVIALVGGPDDRLPDVTEHNRQLMAQKASRPAKKPRSQERGAPAPGPAPAPEDAQRVRATPAARRLAREKGVDLAAVSKKLAGAIVKESDVLAFGGG